jgi:YHS domain-containing protein
MIRSILIFIFILVVYYAVKIVVRSAISAYGKDERPNRLPGDEMVQDPECHTYVVKDRAVTRRIRGRLFFFCSEACARQYEEKNRA